MEDRVLNNTGQSAKLKSLTLPATYEGFVAAAAAGTQLIDITSNDNTTTQTNPGCTVFGTALNKANLLKDETANLIFGRSVSNKTPDDALKELGNALEVINEGEFLSSGWIADGDGWTATINFAASSGITQYSIPIPSLKYSSPLDDAQCRLEQKNYGYIRKFITDTNSITAKASKKPAINFTVIFRGV